MKAQLLTALLSALTLAAPAAQLPESARIDELLAQGWQKAGVKGNPASTEETFVRRVYLDIVGRIPTAKETEAYLSSQEAGKRSQLIDQLLGSEGYVSHSFNYWADVLRLQTDVRGGSPAGYAYADWLKQALRKNQPYNAMVSELLTTDGGIWSSGAVGFYLRDSGMPLDHLATTVQVFLGTSIVCAQCHNHPFDKWTQMDYYHMAAFTYGVNSKGYGDLGFKNKEMAMEGAKMKEQAKKLRDQKANLRVISQSMQDMMKPLRYTTITEREALPRLPHDYQYKDANPLAEVQPAVMFGNTPELKPGEAKTDTFARWMTATDNPRFTTVIANRLWKRAMGMALIEPLDEMTDSSVPANAPLMTYLEELVKAKKYDMKEVLRVIYNSSAYQRAATAVEVPAGETYHFIGPLLRRMTAEQTWDSVVTLLTDAPDKELGASSDALIKRVESLERLYHTLRDLTPEKALAHLDELKANRAEVDKRNESLRAELTKAKEAKDEDEIKRISRVLTRSRYEVSNQNANILFGEEVMSQIREDMRKNGKLGTPKNAKPTAGKPMPTEEMKKEITKLKAEGLDKKAIRARLQEQMNSIMATRRVLEKLPALKRASEIDSPAPRGHFMRLFGQSDRETIENGTPEATVPQALALLNGDAATALYSPISSFRQHIESVPTEQRMDAIYLGLLSRKPTSEERDMLTQLSTERGEKATEDLVQALLNTSQFLFVQ